MRPIARLVSRPLLLHNGSKHSIQLRYLSASLPKRAKNRIYQPVRSVPELDDLLLSSSSSRIPLLTFWTAGWCPSCRAVLPLVQSAIENEKIGEEQGGVSFVEVEYDAPDAAELGMRYMITSIPTLLAFSRGEAQIETKITKLDQLKDREFLRTWIEKEARREGHDGAGGPSLWKSLFGKD